MLFNLNNKIVSVIIQDVTYIVLKKVRAAMARMEPEIPKPKQPDRIALLLSARNSFHCLRIQEDSVISALIIVIN